MCGLVWQCAAALSAWTLYCAAGLRACGGHDRRRTDPRDAPCKLCARERASAETVMGARIESPLATAIWRAEGRDQIAQARALRSTNFVSGHPSHGQFAFSKAFQLRMPAVTLRGRGAARYWTSQTKKRQARKPAAIYFCNRDAASASLRYFSSGEPTAFWLHLSWVLRSLARRFWARAFWPGPSLRRRRLWG